MAGTVVRAPDVYRTPMKFRRPGRRPSFRASDRPHDRRRPLVFRAFFVHHPPERILARHAIPRPADRAQAFGRDGLLAGQADAVIARRKAVERLLDQAQLRVIQAIQPQRDELVVGNLRLVVFRHTAEACHGIELRAEAGEQFGTLLLEHPAIEVLVVRFRSLHIPSVPVQNKLRKSTRLPQQRQDIKSKPGTPSGTWSTEAAVAARGRKPSMTTERSERTFNSSGVNWLRNSSLFSS